MDKYGKNKNKNEDVLWNENGDEGYDNDNNDDNIQINIRENYGDFRVHDHNIINNNYNHRNS